jgi:hypothetical protein
LATNWRKSSYSGGQGGSCVEVANMPGLVSVRDTTQKETGPVLRITADAWKTFTSSIK